MLTLEKRMFILLSNNVTYFIVGVFTEFLVHTDGEHMFLDLDVKLAKYAPPKWKEEVSINVNTM